MLISEISFEVDNEVFLSHLLAHIEFHLILELVVVLDGLPAGDGSKRKGPLGYFPQHFCLPIFIEGVVVKHILLRYIQLFVLLLVFSQPFELQDIWADHHKVLDKVLSNVF